MFNNSYSSSGYSSGSYHNPSHSTWSSSGPGSGLSTSLVDSLTHSRTHQYQSGYLLSATQHVSQGSRKDEPPIVPTEAKMNHILRGSTPGFGTDSMFEPPRLRPNLDDADAPPMASVTDIPSEARTDLTHSQPRNPRLDSHFAVSTSRRQPRSQQSLSSQHPVYIIVFGYPAEKYAITAEYFKSLGRSTEPEPNTEVTNCFKIGFFDAGDALRAVRKSGDIVSGSWMIGVKFADLSQAEALTGLPAPRLAIGGIPSGDFMAVDESTGSSSHAPRIPDLGTPIKLAPSAKAFKKSGPDKGSYASRWGVPPIMPPEGADSAAAPANKGFVGYMSDMIFGW